MAFTFKLQDPGEGIHEAEILEILVQEGDSVEEGDDVLVVETDKAAVEIPAPVTGRVASIKVAVDDIVEVGDVLMTFEEEAVSDDGDDKSDETEDEGADEDRDDNRDEEESEKENVEATKGETDEEVDAKEDSDDNDEARGRAKDGSKDEEATEEGNGLEASAADEDSDDGGGTPATAAKETEKGAKDESDDRKKPAGKREERARDDSDTVLATPAVRGLARDLEVALSEVEGSGDDGRILEEDVRRAAGETEETKTGRDESDDRASNDFDRWGKTERVCLRSIRRATARRMAKAWREIPHVVHQDEIDITDLETLRRAHVEDVEARGGQLTLTPFFVKALGAALKDHPRFNSSLDTEHEEIILKHYYNIGVALDSERGLLVPVIRDVDAKSVVDIAVELTKLGESVRAGRASADQLRGGTFSLTNVGALGGTQFSPIVNYPEAAIFGTARAQLRSVAFGDLVEHVVRARLILPVCLAFDHRINDGADAARFMDDVKTLLSDPEQMALLN